MSLTEAAAYELSELVLAGIQAYKMSNNEEAVGNKVTAMAKEGATMGEISASLRTMNVASETDAQAAIDAKRKAG